MNFVNGASARAALVVTAAILAASSARAETISIESGPTKGGNYVVKIGAQTYYAFTEEETGKVKDAKVDLETTKANLEKTQKALEKSEADLKKTQDAVAAQKEYIQGLEAALKAYENLARTYRKLKDPWVTAELGGGITGDHSSPALMAGIGIKALRIWGFAQKDNAGALLGLSLTVF